jgi:hypothetical protein
MEEGADRNTSLNGSPDEQLELSSVLARSNGA